MFQFTRRTRRSSLSPTIAPALRGGLVVTLAAALVVAASVGALATDAADAASLFAASLRQEQQGQPQAALAPIKTLLARDQGHYLATLRAGWLSYSAGLYDDAVRYYRQAASLEPRALEPRLGLMLPLMALGRWRDAEVVGKAIVTEDGRSYLARSRLSFIYFSQGRYALAESVYRAVLDDYPSDADMRLGLGWTHVRQNRGRDAEKAFRQVLEVQPENASARQGLTALTKI